MNETEPLYIKKLREHIDHKLETHIPKYFIEFKKEIDVRFDEMNNKIETSIDELAISTAKAFSKVATKEDIKDMVTKEDIKDMATKHDIKKILSQQLPPMRLNIFRSLTHREWLS